MKSLTRPVQQREYIFCGKSGKSFETKSVVKKYRIVCTYRNSHHQVSMDEILKNL